MCGRKTPVKLSTISLLFLVLNNSYAGSNPDLCNQEGKSKWVSLSEQACDVSLALKGKPSCDRIREMQDPVPTLAEVLGGKVNPDDSREIIITTPKNEVVPVFVQKLPNRIIFRVRSREKKVNKDCMIFDLLLKENKGELAWIGTEDVDCPIPKKQGGSFLLDLVDLLSKNLGVEKTIVTDASEKRCNKTKKMSDLWFLSIMKNGMTWYEKHGYLPDSNYKVYRERVEALKEFSLSQIQGELESFLEKHRKDLENDPFSNHLKQFREQTDKFHETRKSMKGKELHVLPEPGLGEFMSWLWDEDCESYQSIYHLLFNELKGKAPNFLWRGNLREVMSNVGNMTKYFNKDCHH